MVRWAICILLVVNGLACSGAALRPARLRCEYLVDPVGIDVARPRLSWELRATRAGVYGQRQGGYQVLAASSAELLARGVGDLWDSGRVESDQSIQVEYAGRSLASRTRVWWKVRAWDGDERATGWSEAATWSMGLLSPGEWGGAKWIGLDEPADGYDLSDFRRAQWIWYPEGNPAVAAPVAGRYFRKTFDLPTAKVRRAECFMTADDAGVLFVNGVRVGEVAGNANLLRVELGPGELREGKNVLEVVATNKPAPVEKNPAGMIASLRVEFEDTAVPPIVLASDESWLAARDEAGEWTKAMQLGGVGALPWGDPYGRIWRPEHRRLAGRMLRGAFEAKGEIRRATATVCGLGFFELYLNGEKVGDHWLDPGLTEYSKRCLYVTFDVTKQVKRGENAVGVMLGNGRFYAPRLSVPVPTVTFGFPKVIANVRVEYADGTTEDVVTDEKWKVTAEGSIRANSEYDGEEYDARREQGGWDEIGFDDSGWKAAQVVAVPGGVMRAQMMEPVRVTGVMKPVAIAEPTPGVFVVDFGQAFYGVTRIHVRGEAGRRVEMRSSFAVRPDGMLKTENDRSALNTDVYVLKGGGEEVWSPRFKGTATRRVQVTRWPGRPRVEDFEGLVLGTDYPAEGEFACSNELINKIFSNARWGTRMQNRSIPMEPDRDERQGWSGHPAKTSESEGWNFGVAPFYANWLRGVGMEQHADGSLQEISPGYWTFSSKGSIWPAIVTIIPNWMYDFYGDRRVVAENYETMKRWVEYHVRVNQRPDFTLDHHSYDDWVDATRIGMQDVPTTAAETMPMISTGYHYYNCKLVARAAGILGKAEDEQRFAALAEKVKAGFNKRFFDEKAERYGDGRQFAYVMPLAFGMVPEGHRAGVVRNLVDQIMVKDGGHTSVGLLGTQWEMQALTDIGHPEVAYAIATQTTRPSWGYMIAKGATTIWERWDTDTQGGGMNGESQKILSGNFEAWCYQALAGINYDPERPGFKHVILRPRLVGNLTWARGSHRSMYGEVRSEWRKQGEEVKWDVVVPPNTTATAYVPGDHVKVSDNSGAKFVQTGGGVTMYELRSGTYSFESVVTK